MRQIPKPWPGERSSLWPAIQRAGRSLLMLDYDGTLAPFAADRFRALPYYGVADRLLALSELAVVRLVLISGRPAREVRAMLPPAAHIETWGSHGREHLDAQGSYALHAADQAQLSELDRYATSLAHHGFANALEQKPGSLAVHWRTLDSALQQRLRDLVLELYSNRPRGAEVELLYFDGGLELRASGRTKGSAVDHILLTETRGTPAAYLGDDETDEDAFAAMGERGVSILVRSEPRPTLAQFWLAPPDALLAFLECWIESAARAAPAQITKEHP